MNDISIVLLKLSLVFINGDRFERVTDHPSRVNDVSREGHRL
jgi:hypothetical protein